MTAATPTEAAHDETFWRGRFSALQKAIADGQSSVEKLQSEINGLTASVAGRDDPAEREVLRQQLSNAMRELDRVQSKLETDRRAVETMRRDARHEGAPPGWLR